jgi:KAP-like P-loop domain-containing protein
VRSIDLLRINSRHEADVPKSLKVSPPDDTSTSSERWRGTVWFNPWKYENSEQLWAGLANEIILQVTSRLNRIDRQAFWIDLNWRRFDKTKVQQLMNRPLFTRIIPSVVAAVILLTFAVAGILAVHILPSLGSTVIKTVTGGTALVAGVALALVVIHAGRILTGSVEETLPFLAGPTSIMTPIKRSLQNVMEAGFIDPNYASRLGFLEFVQSDVTNVLDLIATDERPLVVFVDDLDRCSSGTISGVIEAINLFLAGEYKNCIFILGLDPAIVAAHIESTYKDMAQTLAIQRDDMPGLGWSFLDKFVQLPLLLPRPRAETLKSVYMSALLQSGQPRDGFHPMEEDSQSYRPQGSDDNSRAVTSTGHMDETHEHREYMMSESQIATVSNLVKAMTVRAPNLDTLPSVAREAELDIFGDSEGPLRPETLEAASRIFSGLYSDTSAAPSIHRGLTWLASRNPREIKRFVNLFRFYYFLAEQRRLQSEPITADEVAKVAALIIRWPQVLGRLLVGTEKLSVLDRLERWIAANPPDSSDDQAPEDERQRDPPKGWDRLLIDCQVFPATDGEGSNRIAVQLHSFLSEAPSIAHAIRVLL